MKDSDSRLLGHPGPWSTLLGFTVVGSAAAAAMLTALTSLPLLSMTSGLGHVAIPALLFLFWMALGFAPAFTVGVVALIIRPHLSTRLVYAVASFAVAAAAWSAVYLLLFRDSGGQPLIAIIGGLSALICAPLTWRTRARAQEV